MRNVLFFRETIPARISPAERATWRETDTDHIISAFFFSCLKQNAVIEKTFDRPTFFDWLFRRKRTVKIHVGARDVKLDPPLMPQGETLRVYEFREKSIGFLMEERWLEE